MRLYSKEEWAQIPWPCNEEGQWLRSFFEGMLKEGVTAYISNVRSSLFMLHCDDLLIPITVNETEYGNSYVCSLYSFVSYAEAEMKRHGKYLLRILSCPFLTMLKLWFRLSGINRLVIVNNFFLSTNLYGKLLPHQVKCICTFLQQRFPDYTIIFRSLNTLTEEKLIDTLALLGSDFITTRSVYFFDPKRYSILPSKKRWIIQKDKKLQDKHKIQIIQHNEFCPEDAPEIKRLYDLLYLEKYSLYNPSFTVRFFEQVIQNKTCTLTGLKYDGRLVGVIGFFAMKGIMATPIVGYDTQAPEQLGLYRLLTACVLEQSLVTGTLFHMSAGVGHFKRQRGAFQEIETMAAVCGHLSFHRRILWKTLGVFFNRVGSRILVKNKL
jgi:hypothetical protein